MWTAGYYEAHVTVPGVLDFYGDLRIGGPFGVIGGFNRDLGWSTTNNDPLLAQVYAVDADPTTTGTQELKQWQALLGYVSALPDTDDDDIPNIPAAYGSVQGRIVEQ